MRRIVEACETFVDIHCHLVPGIDDGAKSWQESLAMARMAVADGIETIVVTPHQLGGYAHNSGEMIRQRTAELQRELDAHDILLRVLPGADVRIDNGMIEGLKNGSVLTLGDHGRHVLLELPHEMYFPLEPVLDDLTRAGMVGILSHPERNQGLLKQPALIESLVDYGCLMQVTAGSLTGTFGPNSQDMAEWMLGEGLVHFISTDAHGPRARRPLLGRAFQRAAEMAGEETAIALCCGNPAAVASGHDVEAIPRKTQRNVLASWFSWRKAG
ncbi:MAG TPA: CpsB/CapC family capsule biosynthesis tyrosine phosphatase [Pirellulaceae bacterium]|nr:CpsB/CapC family capsule biosynthesis tyrosine phosphatase [Pirellulaceae bacterium]